MEQALKIIGIAIIFIIIGFALDIKWQAKTHYTLPSMVVGLVIEVVFLLLGISTLLIFASLSQPYMNWVMVVAVCFDIMGIIVQAYYIGKDRKEIADRSKIMTEAIYATKDFIDILLYDIYADGEEVDENVVRLSEEFAEDFIASYVEDYYNQ